MKVLFILHGMPPLPGRTVVGSGLRAFALGEGLRHRNHRVFYATRHVDLPDDLKSAADQRRKRRSVVLPTHTGPIDPPGDPQRLQRPRAPIGPTPDDGGDSDAAQISMNLPAIPRGAAVFPEGLAPWGGSLGSPGNPFPYTETHEVHDILRRVDPDVVVVCALEEARRLPAGRFATVIDLFAPRILEQQFQPGADEREAVRVLDALQRGDWFLFSNDRQKYFHLPLLAMAGVDCTRAVGDVVPISAPPEVPAFEKPRDLLFVAGGVFWPWADLGPGLAVLLDSLDQMGKGEVRLYGGRYGIQSDTGAYKDPRDSLPANHARLDFRGMLPVEQLWDEYRQASVAFDLMAPNPERELNLSFRQIDYLRCGLPIITAPGQVIADDLVEYGAGWLVDPQDERALRRLVADLAAHPEKVARASSAAQRLVRDRYAWDRTIAPLDAFVTRPMRRERAETLVATMARTQADLWEEQEDARRLREGLDHLRADLDKKEAEIQRQDERIRTLLGAVDGLTRSIEEVGKFKNAAITFLGEGKDLAAREAGELRDEIERRDLDLQKRGEALAAAQSDLLRLQRSIAESQAEIAALTSRYVDRDGAATALEHDCRGLQGRIVILERENAERRREVEQKARALAEAAGGLVEAEQRMLDRMDAAELRSTEQLAAVERRATEEVAVATERWQRAENARATLKEEVASLRPRVAELVAEAEKKEAEVHRALSARERDLAAAESRRLAEVSAVEGRASVALQAADLRIRAEAEASELRRLQEVERAEGALAALAQRDQALAVARDGVARFRLELHKKSEELRAAEERALDARATAERLGIELTRIESEDQRLRAEERRLTLESRKKQQDLEAAEATRLELAGELETMRATCARLSDELGPLRLEWQAARVELGKKRDELEAMERRRIDAQTSAQAAAASLDQRTAEAGVLRSELGAAVADLDKQRERATAAELRQQEAAVAQLRSRSRIEALEADLATARTERATLANELEKKAGELERRQAEVAALRAWSDRTASETERRAESALERAEERARTLIDELRVALARAEDERGTLRGRLEEGEQRRREAERNHAAARDLADTLEERLQTERARADAATADAGRLRDKLSETRTHGADLEAEAARRSQEAAAFRQDASAALARLEQVEFEWRGARADLDKKDRELREAALVRTRAEEEGAAHRARIEGELAARDAEIGRLQARLAEQDYDRAALAADVAKKTREIDDLNVQLARVSEASRGLRR